MKLVHDVVTLSVAVHLGKASITAIGSYTAAHSNQSYAGAGAVNDKGEQHGIRRKAESVRPALVKVFGYRIEKLRDTVKAPIDVLDLLLTKVSAERSDFFFVQIGANNGLTDDPLRQFVTKYHWHGCLVEPQPQVFQQLLKNYAQEKQLAFENSAIADRDGTADCSSRTIRTKLPI